MKFQTKHSLYTHPTSAEAQHVEIGFTDLKLNGVLGSIVLKTALEAGNRRRRFPSHFQPNASAKRGDLADNDGHEHQIDNIRSLLCPRVLTCHLAKICLCLDSKEHETTFASSQLHLYLLLFPLCPSAQVAGWNGKRPQLCSIVAAAAAVRVAFFQIFGVLLLGLGGQTFF
ncbi:hypothetical protein HDK90DRAFT_494103 [Phyllosticta capitalensis]|uniref:Uncharacterized protein n=1 Tax=Phyllosticta capitalensis TaxID=121624 RepID=A0ABR1YDP6_9PEZI